MSREKEQYKNLILEAARLAVKGGICSTFYEDFVIDHIDKIIDGLSENDFTYLVMNGRIPVKAIQTDEEHTAFIERLTSARTLREKELTDFDRLQLKSYIEVLEDLLNEYQAISPEPDVLNISDTDKLQQWIFEAADILDDMNPDDPKFPEYEQYYQSLWDRLREIEEQGGAKSC